MGVAMRLSIGRLSSVIFVPALALACGDPEEDPFDTTPASTGSTTAPASDGVVTTSTYDLRQRLLSTSVGGHLAGKGERCTATAPLGRNP